MCELKKMPCVCVCVLLRFFEWLRQEAHLISSLQDLFKDQEKRIATAVLAS